MRDDLVAQRGAQQRVDGAPGLVEQDDGRARRERARQRDALLLAAGELVGEAVAQVAEADQVEHLGDAVAAALAAGQAEADVGGDVQVREQRVVLEHHAHAAAVGRGPGAVAGDLRAVDLDAAGVGALEAGEHAQSGRLAAAGRAAEGDDLAARDVRGSAPSSAWVEPKRLADVP